MTWIKFRFTKQFGRYNYKVLVKTHREHNLKKIKQVPLPAGLRKLSVQVHDPNDADFPRKTTPDPIFHTHPYFPPKLPLEKQPLYKKTPCFLYDGSEILSEGVDQALNLTHSVLRQGLPAGLLKRVKNVDFKPDHEELLRRYILHSQSWDSANERLPNRHDPVRFWLFHGVMHGIPLERRQEILLDDLYRYSMSFTDQFPSLKKLSSHLGSHLNACFERTKDERICVVQKPHRTILTKQSLPPIDEPRETIGESLVDIFPIKSVIDLRPDHLYRRQPEFPRKKNSHVHTILSYHVQDQKYPWTPAELQGRLILNCFAAAVATAQNKYRKLVGDLKEPVVTQGVQLTGSVADFVLVQLNTLSMENKAGVKNLVYLDGNNKFYADKNYWEPFEQVENLNPEVFSKFLALLVNANESK